MLNARLLVLLLAMTAGLSAQGPGPEMKVVNAAAEALGGRNRILAIKTLKIQGYGHQAYQLGGGNISSSADAPQKWIHLNDYERTFDLENRRTRIRQRAVTGFPFARLANYGRVRANQVLDGTIGFNVGGDGTVTRAPDTVARTRRLEMLAHPIVIVRAALDPGTKVSNLRSAADAQVMDLTTADGDRLTLGVDRTTNLPSWVSWIGRDENLGDVTYQTYFTGYARTAGVLLPMGYSTRIDFRNVQFQTLMVDRNFVDVPVDDMAAPAAVRAAAAPAPRPTPKATQLSKGIWFITGGSHNSVVLEFADHLTLFESPSSDAWATDVIALARTLVPSKPLTEVIVTHHHFDHTGGLRAAVAQGLTVITHRGNAGLFREMASRKSTVDADSLGRNPRPITLRLVDEELTLKDSSMEIHLYRIAANNHLVDAVFGYVPREKLLVQADMFVLDWDFQWWGNAYMDSVRRWQLQVDRDVPIHGPVVTFAEIGPNIEKQFRNAQAFCNEGLKAGFPVPGCPATN